MRTLAFLSLLALAPADLPPEIRPEDFAKLHALIRPPAGEFAWRDEIPWLLSLGEARAKAAAEGKPILIWNAADGSPLGPV